MLFNSVVFLVFFAIAYGLYWALGTNYKWQNRMLLVASYVFYGYWDWRFLSLIVLSTVVDYHAAHGMVRTPVHAKRFLTASVVTNLGLLFSFKYFGFFTDSLVRLVQSVGIDVSPVAFDIVLPVGISFYTFQTMSYTIDVYRGKLEPCRDFLDFALFVSFFPQLVAGPIERAVRLLPQITGPRRPSRDQLREGVWLIAWGYFKKVYVADNLAFLVQTVFDGGWSGSGSEALIGVYAFAFQIYCDFSGYSDIARGLSKLMGIDLTLNFNLPYFATSPSDFWRRWHISLSSWLRDYLYISLGGNRGGVNRTYRNLMLTMVLGGLWHGAAWTFVAWGIYHGLLLIVYRVAEDLAWVKAAGAKLSFLPAPLRRGVAMFVMFHLTCVSWVFFRAHSVTQAFQMIGQSVVDLALTPVALQMGQAVLGFAAILLVVQVFQYLRKDLLVALRVPAPVRSAFYALLFYMIVLHGTQSDAFIYFQF